MLFLVALITNSVFVFSNLGFKSVDFIGCTAPALPLGLAVISFVLLFIFVGLRMHVHL